MHPTQNSTNEIFEKKTVPIKMYKLMGMQLDEMLLFKCWIQKFLHAVFEHYQTTVIAVIPL